MRATEGEQFRSDPVLTKAAVRAVSSPCANVVDDALMYLERFGDKSARQPILDRYLRWSERWTGKPEKPNDDESREDNKDRRLGYELAGALLGNQGWVADAALAAVVLQHCVGRDMCDSVTRFTKQALDVSATQSPDGTHYRVGVTSLHSNFSKRNSISFLQGRPSHWSTRRPVFPESSATLKTIFRCCWLSMV